MAWLWTTALAANYLVAVFVIASILRRQKEPMAMLAWIFAILLAPFAGWMLYWLVGSTRIHRKAHRRRKRIAHLVKRVRRHTHERARDGEGAAIERLPSDLATVERMTRRLLGVPATSGNEVRVYEEANATYYALEEAIREARECIHLEYYVWQPDATGRHFRDLLVEKAKSGVRCRLLLDAVGSWRIGKSFTQPLIDAGGQVAFFLSVNPLRKRWSINLRNHRKIAVIDGSVAFMGSQNIGDEYLGRLKRLSPWRDTHMRVIGPAVLFLQQTFVEDWLFATGENLSGAELFPEPRRPGGSLLQTVATGPDQDVRVLEQIIFAAVSTASNSIQIETPYFVPGTGLRMALTHASYRGVRVRIVLPTRHDHPVVLWAGRSFYGELLQAGVEIYEYDAGVVHSKIITVDDRWCMLGSANMDVRSFRLNFEVTALIYDARVAVELSRSIDRNVSRSRRIGLEDVRGRRLHEQLIEGAARILSPLL